MTITNYQPSKKIHIAKYKLMILCSNSPVQTNIKYFITKTQNTIGTGRLRDCATYFIIACVPATLLFSFIQHSTILKKKFININITNTKIGGWWVANN